MALSPIDSNGKVDNDTVYMVYAGTEPKEPADIGTDVKLGLSGIFDDQIKTNPKDVKFMMNIKIYPKPFVMNFPIIWLVV